MSWIKMKVIVLFILSLLFLQFISVANAAVEQQDAVKNTTVTQQKSEVEDATAVRQKAVESVTENTGFDTGIAGFVVSIIGVIVGLLIFWIQTCQNKKLETQSEVIATQSTSISEQNTQLADLTQKMDKNIILLDKKVFGSLYSIGDTVRSMLDFISRAEEPAIGNTKNQVNDLYIMAYWLWFGIDDQWHDESDIENILNSELHRKIETRLLEHAKRGNKSKTVIIIFDPEKMKSELVKMICGIIHYKAAEQGWNIEDDKVNEYSNNIYSKYVGVLKGMNARLADCGRGNGDELFFSNRIPNIIFAQRCGSIRNGISFLGEIDFLNKRFNSVQTTATSPDTEASEFFGFQTHDSRMVASLIKQIDLVKKEYCEDDQNHLTKA